MFLEFNDEQLELRDSARAALGRLCPPHLVHEVADGATDGAQVDTELGWLGWPALAIDVDLGGLGRTFVELAVVLEELGRAAAPGSFLPTATQFVPVVREAGTTTQAHRYLAGVASGELTRHRSRCTRADAGSPRPSPSTAERDGDGWLLRGHKQHVLGAPAVDEVVVSARCDAGPLGLFVVPAAELTFKRTDSIDVTRCARQRRAQRGLGAGRPPPGRGRRRRLPAARPAHWPWPRSASPSTAWAPARP